MAPHFRQRVVELNGLQFFAFQGQAVSAAGALQEINETMLHYLTSSLHIVSPSYKLLAYDFI
jgi:hypothetical protein